MNEPINQFEYLRMPGYPTDGQLTTKAVSVFNSSSESITIYIGTADNLRFACGYYICFTSGRSAMNKPSFEAGYFTSERNAVLYFLGYMKKYSSYFSREALDVIDKMINEYSQLNIF